jgi:recombination protein RecR
VAQPTDIPVVEKSGAYKGAYFVLHGVLDPSQGKTLYDLPLPQLRKRVEGGRFEEVILALNPTQEGEATARVIQDLLKNLPVKITRPAYGIPIGSQLDFVDEYTLSLAFRHRRSVEETP